jgi:hypothetical protein
MNREIRETYLDANEKPVNPSTQIPELKYGYDKCGNKNYSALADGKGNIINHPKDAWAIQRCEYDIRGKLLNIKYYDKNEKPCVNKEDSYNYYKKTYIYDKQGYNIESRYYDTDENLRKNFYAIERMKYDEQGNNIESRYYDADENLRKNYYAIGRMKYDEQGNLTEYAMFNYLDKATDYNNWHKIVQSFDEQGNPQYRKYYKANGSLLGTMKYNTRTKEWEVDTYTPVVVPSSDKSWQEYWKTNAPNYPATISDEIEISSVSIQSTGCMLTIRFLQISKYDISDSELAKLKSEISELAKLKSEAGMPNNTTLTCICVDKAKRELFRLTY